jgi:hypothetical protein
MVIFILSIFIIFSGCIEESKVNQSNESVHQRSVNITPENLSSTILSSKEENIPEIEITSFSSIYTHTNVENIYGYLFSWDDVPGSENQRLVDYLMNFSELGWVNNSHIMKTDDNKKIRIFTSEHSLEFTLDNKTNSVLTIVDSEPFYDLKLKEENGKVCVYKLEEYKHGYNNTEKCYAIYNLSITNNGSSDLDFKLNALHINYKDHFFNTTFSFNALEGLDSYLLEVISDLQKENKIENTTLLPGQTINGSVFFQVDSLYDESFLLMYKDIPITSASFGKSTEALRIAERFKYSTAFGVPPYKNIEERSYFEPDFNVYPWMYANWVNRSIFEFFNKADSELFNKEVSKDGANSSMGDMPITEIVYALKVIPEQNITFVQPYNRFSVGSDVNRFRGGSEIEYSLRPNHFIVVDDTGEELINTSRNDKIVFINTDIPHMTLSNATIVKISFQGNYGRSMDMRLLYINQDVILDDKQNITVARCHCFNPQT